MRSSTEAKREPAGNVIVMEAKKVSKRVPVTRNRAEMPRLRNATGTQQHIHGCEGFQVSKFPGFQGSTHTCIWAVLKIHHQITFAATAGFEIPCGEYTTKSVNDERLETCGNLSLRENLTRRPAFSFQRSCVECLGY
jgi:hypothetical protein